MTPEEEVMRDMWIAECWAVVPEYHAPIDPRKHVRHVVRKPVDKPRGKAD